METEGLREIKFRVSTDFVADQFPEYIEREYPNAKGYLLSAGEAERIKNQYIVSVFFVDAGGIVITDNWGMIGETVKHFVKLNKHANFLNAHLGYINDDFMQMKVSANICFTFYS